MEIEELRIKQAEFEGARQEFQKKVLKLKKEREKFLKLFSEKKLKSLKLEQYALQKEKTESKNSFCYWIETKLETLGNIHGAKADKFGIYYGVKKSDSTKKYRFANKFGTNKNEAFLNIKSAILSLLYSAKNNNLDNIKNNQLSPMFKGKILSVYFPNKFLNIFAKKDLDYFLDKLDISYLDSLDEIDKRNLLMQFKTKDIVMKNWNIYEFSKFLYEKFGKPVQTKNIPEKLKDYITPKYPPLNKVKADFISLNIIEIPKKQSAETKSVSLKKIDFEQENKINKKTGNRGELVVLNKEKEYLESINKKELSIKVEHTSTKTDSAGYDILSFDKNGNKIYIEVKSTKQKAPKVNFLISANEYRQAKILSNYYVYIVFEAHTISPKIWKLKKPFDLSSNKIKITPTNYRVEINLT